MVAKREDIAQAILFLAEFEDEEAVAGRCDPPKSGFEFDNKTNACLE
jgi:hypothetical protein